MELPRLQRLRVIVEKIESKNMLSEHSCLLLILDYLKCVAIYLEHFIKSHPDKPHEFRLVV